MAVVADSRLFASGQQQQEKALHRRSSCNADGSKAGRKGTQRVHRVDCESSPNGSSYSRVLFRSVNFIASSRSPSRFAFPGSAASERVSVSSTSLLGSQAADFLPDAESLLDAVRHAITPRSSNVPGSMKIISALPLIIN